MRQNDCDCPPFRVQALKGGPGTASARRRLWGAPLTGVVPEMRRGAPGRLLRCCGGPSSSRAVAALQASYVRPTHSSVM